MGIHKVPSYEHCWSEDDYLRVEPICRIMPKTRYEKLSQYLHVSNDSSNPARGQPGHDPIAKVRPVWDMACTAFRDSYQPHRELSVDEAMIAFKGRLSSKQYMPIKPIKWGIKVWELADSTNGYVLDMEMYTGKGSHPQLVRGRGLGFHVVDSLCQRYYGKAHHVYFDSYYTSVPLVEHLENNGTYACGTIRQNRIGLPPAIKKAKPKVAGESVKRQKGNMVATVWYDKRKVTLLSTCQNPTDGMIERRQRGRAQPLTISRPHAISNYNRFMGGVDLSDQLRSYYRVGRSSVKWWRYLLWFVVDMCIINSFIIYSETEHVTNRSEKKKSHLQFRLCVAKSLVAGFSSRKKAGRKRRTVLSEMTVHSDNIHSHKLIKLTARKKACVQCSQKKRRTPSGRATETSFQCAVCVVALCKTGCFTEFHHEHMQ